VVAVQTVCTFFVGELQLGATGQVQFVLNIEPPPHQMVMSAVVVAVYAAQEGQVLSTHISVVPIRQPSEIVRLFLPFVVNWPPRIPDILGP
jgi:hypothetical protein